ncbi:MAG: NAD-dependent epimerase/dehydratase family protein [Verrucomicrobia bacterium]|jgi:nucleoside-diphosphate-sugar epimerase|nr:NAD-dependent epimerase/dehydratase family protein [Verrucomicrobiota bacterium]MDA1045639.1 NAD-dependent epimerase/dehydratase family protein [Verrucomicrobiota bacterium]
MKVLVTGGSGFIGGRVVRRLLENGHEVHVIGRTTPKEETSSVFHQVDLARETIPEVICQGVDAVFHIAAKAGVWGSASSYHAANVSATRQILEACRTHSINILIHTSSPSVVFSGESFRGADESLPYGSNWLCHYARTKAEAEREVLAANGKSGLKTLALRPHLVWGPGDPHLLPKAIARHMAGKLRIVGSGENHMDLTHVDNVAHAHILALDALASGRHSGGQAYFISQDDPVALWKWLNHLFSHLDLPPLSKKVSFRSAHSLGFVLELIWKVLRLTGEPPMTRFVAVQLAKDHWFSIDAARRDLGYEPIVSMKDGLSDTVDWLKASVKGLG